MLVTRSRIGKLEPSLNKSLSLELETPSAYFTEEALGKIYFKVFTDRSLDTSIKDKIS